MSERTFTLQFTEEERTATLYALGFFFKAMRDTVAGGRLEKLEYKLQHAIADDCRDVLPQPNSGTEAARAVLAPPAAPPAGILVRDERDYFARDRKGNTPALPPDGAELKTVQVLQAKESADKKYLTVVFQGGKANCFDSALWPRIVKGPSVQSLWLTKSDKYTNIVGVRA